MSSAIPFATPDETTLAPIPCASAEPLLADLPGGFAELGAEFFSRVPPIPLPAPYLVGFSRETAALIGLDPSAAHDPAFIERFSGSAATAAGAPATLATVYSGHQFGVWAGQLGDGRALLLGEAEHAGGRNEVQLKGAGLTPYSRMGDGRAVLRSSIREFLASEAMHHLGVPTTRALCVIGSDFPIRRETLETAAVVTRVAPSFVRFGHFQHFAALERDDLLARLADHVIDLHLPHCRSTDDPYLALLDEATRRTAELLALWQTFGFCHGVMNTDNMSILGLTIDYGPYGFMDGFNANHICNHSDTGGRYAYRMQPSVALWNLTRLAQALLPLIGKQRGASADEDLAVADARGVLEHFSAVFDTTWRQRMHAKLGLTTERDGDAELIESLFALMQANRADFTLTFRRLATLSTQDEAAGVVAGAEPARDLFLDRAAFDAWAARYRTRLLAEGRPDAERATAMNRVNPKYVLRNHLAETAIIAAREREFGECERLLEVLRHPFDEQPERAAYAALPPDWATELEVSCSS